MKSQNRENEATLQLPDEKQVTDTGLGINSFRPTTPGGRGPWNDAFKVLKELFIPRHFQT